ncbi:MAG TPA: methyl-accepting chemotaxis protein [Bacillota bacterium]|nr:methyl-accepting chemotaxis protein [Bacillota bacterium]
MFKHFNLQSIRTRLVITSILLLTVPIIVLGFLSYQEAKSSLDSHGAKRLETSVELTIALIESLNEEVEKGNLTLAEAQEKVKVTVLGEKDENGQRPINENIDLGQNGYIFILDQEGNQVAHPQIEGSNVWEEEDEDGVKFAQEMIKVGNSGGGLSYYQWPLPNDETRLEEKVTYTRTDPHWNWAVNASTYMMDFNQEANGILHFIFITIGIALVVGLIVIWIFASRIANPIKAVTERMNIIEQGQLNQEPLAINSKDEIGQLARSLNRMQDGLRNLVQNVFNASQTMTSRSEELSQAAFEVSEGSEQMAATMEELAGGAETQANDATHLSSMMNSFVENIDTANKDVTIAQQNSTEVVELTNRGRELMNTSTTQMEMIDQLVHDAVEKVEGLDQHSQQISELVAVIQDIAEQTNLLALNAAIEAARAGEHGQGFAVVADEVRKLAEQSASSVTNITDIAHQIQTEASVVADSLREGYEEVEQGTIHIRTTGETFNEISEAITSMGEHINHVTEKLQEIVTNSAEMGSSIENIAAISEQSAAGVQQSTAGTEETNAAMQEVAGSSEELAKLAEELNSLIEQFDL